MPRWMLRSLVTKRLPACQVTTPPMPAESIAWPTRRSIWKLSAKLRVRPSKVALIASTRIPAVPSPMAISSSVAGSPLSLAKYVSPSDSAPPSSLEKNLPKPAADEGTLRLVPLPKSTPSSLPPRCTPVIAMLLASL